MPQLTRRTLASLLTVAVFCASAAAIPETHLNEIAKPCADFAQTQVDALGGVASPSKNEKKDLKTFTKLVSKLGKAAIVVKDDFKELFVAAKSQKKVRDAAVATAMDVPLDEGFLRAEIALDERSELVDDYRVLIADAKQAAKIEKVIGKYDAARATADGSSTNDKRAKLLGKAEKQITKALKKAEKTLVKQGLPADRFPPPRFRSGDRLGLGGGRVAIPKNADSPAAGMSVIIPPFALDGLTEVTLTAGVSFVGAPDEPAGGALELGPPGLTLNVPATAFVPFDPPQGADPSAYALFHKVGDEITPNGNVEDRGNGMLSGPVPGPGTVQAGVRAPIPGTPTGLYHIQLLTSLTSVPQEQDQRGTFFVGILEQDMTFRTSGSVTGITGSITGVARQFLPAPPHHQDLLGTLTAGGFDSLWSSDAAGTFEMTFPLFSDGTPIQADLTGRVSADGRVIVLSGRGGTLEFTGIGVKEATEATSQDLVGRWLSVETGVQFQNPDADPGAVPPVLFSTPFVSRQFSTFSWFTGETVQPTEARIVRDPAGMVYETNLTYDTSVGNPVHSQTSTVVPDGGTTDVFVLNDGKVAVLGQLFSGRLDPQSGVFVSSRIDTTNGLVVFRVAVRQPDPTTATFEGMFACAGMDVGSLVSAVPDENSDRTVFPFLADFTAVNGGLSTFATVPGEVSTYSLSGPGPLSAVPWTLTNANTPFAPAAEQFMLELDSGGNHLPAVAERLLGISGDGQIILGIRDGGGPDLLKGILIGLRSDTP